MRASFPLSPNARRFDVATAAVPGWAPSVATISTRALTIADIPLWFMGALSRACAAMGLGLKAPLAGSGPKRSQVTPAGGLRGRKRPSSRG
jgi:hypothetical protein